MISLKAVAYIGATVILSIACIVYLTSVSDRPIPHILVAVASAALALTAPTTKGAGLALRSIPAASTKAFWVRLTAANPAPADGDGGTWRREGDTSTRIKHG